MTRGLKTLSSKATPVANPITVFIDFDGVFHPLGACTWLDDEQSYHFVKPFRWWPEFLAALKPLHNEVSLVVHSTWRLLWESDAEIKALMPPEMAKYIRGCTPRDVMGRLARIEAYVPQNKVDRFVIIDDEAQAFPRATLI
jgi:hypothetical protein